MYSSIEFTRNFLTIGNINNDNPKHTVTNILILLVVNIEPTNVIKNKTDKYIKYFLSLRLL